MASRKTKAKKAPPRPAGKSGKSKAPRKTAAKKASSAKTAKKAAKKAAAKTPAKKKAAKKKTARKASGVVDQIQQVVDVMVSAGAVEVEMDDGSTKLRIRLKEEQPTVAYAAPAPAAVVEAGSTLVDRGPAEAGAPALAAESGDSFRSPMVGTFYRASSPDAEPFAKVGDHVTADSVICIIEAMKVMNEIKAETEGQIVEILAQNGEPVDYGQPLFVIKS